MRQFSIYTGVFPCHQCHETVSQLRFWYETLDLTWKCDEGHISKVSLARRKRNALTQ